MDTLPDIEAMADALIGIPYAQCDCWQLLRRLFEEGWGLQFDADPSDAMKHVQEIWFRGDSEDPLALVRPWDVLIFRMLGRASSHVGVVVNATQFIHTRESASVCLEPMQHPAWKRQLLQIARLQQLL